MKSTPKNFMRDRKIGFIKKSTLVLFILILNINLCAQNIAITDNETYSPNSNAMLDVYSLNKGLLIPRVSLLNPDDPIAGVKEIGMLVWNVSNSGNYQENGFYFWNGTDWEMLGSNNIFENGLTKTGYSVGLGGSLNKITTLNLANYSFNMNLNGSGNFDVQDDGVSSLFVANNGNVGIGNNTPAHKLHVSGNLSIGDNLFIESTSNYGKYHNLATYSANTTIGAFVINTNQTGSTMFIMKITGYFYSGPGPYEITIKGYWTGSTCNNGGYTIVGPDDFAVRIAKNSSGAMTVILGDEGTSYSYPKFTVTEYYQGYTSPNASYADGWTFTQETDLTNYTNMVILQNSTANPNYYDNSHIDNLESQIVAEDLWNRTGTTTYLKNTTDKVGIGSSSPAGILHIRSTNTNTIGTDGTFLHIQNYSGSTGVMSGIRFSSGTNVASKGAIFYQDKASYNRGNIIFANRNTTNWTTVTAADARMIINYKGDVGIGNGNANPTSRLTVQGNSSGQVDDPLFEVKNNSGETVFAVYNEGVRVWVNDDPSKATGSRGGFAVGGFSTGKGLTNEFLRVTPDSVRVYINSTSAKATGSRGGFAVGGFSTGKGNPVNLMELNKENYFIGHESGLKTTGSRNFFAGFQAGKANITGDANVFLGPETGISNIHGNRNIFIGWKAGKSNIGIEDPGITETIGHDNIYIGTKAGESNSVGEHNSFIGSYSGYNSSGDRNTFLGAFTGFATSGTSNVFLGVDAGRNNASGNNNVFLGAIAGNSNSGSNNTFLGFGAGYNNTTGSGNVFIGKYAGLNELTSNKLYIDNSSTATPLIYGNFSSNYLKFNGNVGINEVSTNFALRVNLDSDDSWAIVAYGECWTNGTWQGSDIRFKKNISTFDNALDKVLKLRGVSFDWKNEDFKEYSFSDKRSVGFIAQEVEKVLPEFVKDGPEGYKTVSYDKFSPILVEAIKEQQKQIEDLKLIIKESNQKIIELNQKLDKLNDLEEKLNELSKTIDYK